MSSECDVIELHLIHVHLYYPPFFQGSEVHLQNLHLQFDRTVGGAEQTG